MPDICPHCKQAVDLKSHVENCECEFIAHGPIPCWDCGSTIFGHHTPDCSFSGEDDILDLPQVPGTQWWDKKARKAC